MSDTKSGFSAEERAAMKQRVDELRAMKGVKGAAKKAKEYEACVALDDGEMWPVSFAVIEMTDAAERRIRELVRRAVS